MIYVSGAVCEGSSEVRYEELKKETQKKKKKNNTEKNRTKLHIVIILLENYI